MIIDAIDSQGRRYFEVPIFPDGPLKKAFEHFDSCDPCVECGKHVKHAYERYFQRNDLNDGAGDGLASILLGLTYDVVCAECGDRLIRESSS